MATTELFEKIGLLETFWSCVYTPFETTHRQKEIEYHFLKVRPKDAHWKT